jgi:hypothetical protein
MAMQSEEKKAGSGASLLDSLGMVGGIHLGRRGTGPPEVWDPNQSLPSWVDHLPEQGRGGRAGSSGSGGQTVQVL